MKYWHAFVLLGIATLTFVAVRAHYDAAPPTPPPPPSTATTSTVMRTETPTTTPVRVPILVYHGVRDTDSTEPADVRQFNIAPSELERQLTYLNENGFTPIHFSDLDTYFDSSAPLPPKPVILSFDDGWRSQYLHGLPLLKKHNITATFFIFSNGPDHTNFMTWDEVRKLVSAGMEIGSHSRSHQYMTKQERGELPREMAGSKQVFRDELQVEVTTFSYPFGLYDTDMLPMLRDAGYTTARTLERSTIQSRDKRLELASFLAPKDMENFVYILEVLEIDALPSETP